MQHSLRSHQNFFPLSFFLVVEKRWHNEVIRRKWWNYRFHICSIHVPSTKCSVWWKYVGKICSTTTHRKYHWSPLEDGHYIIYHQKNRSILENRVKFIFDHPTLASVWFWSLNSKTGYLRPLNYENRLFLTIGLFWGPVLLTWTPRGSGAHLSAPSPSPVSFLLSLSSAPSRRRSAPSPARSRRWAAGPRRPLTCSLLPTLAAPPPPCFLHARHGVRRPWSLGSPATARAAAGWLRAPARELQQGWAHHVRPPSAMMPVKPL